MNSVQPILDKALSGLRISETEALELLQFPDWTSIVAAGHARRIQMHGDKIVSYTAFRVINYTNFCDVDCSFCSFKDEITSERGYNLSLEDISRKTQEAMELGADHIFFQGGVNPNLPLTYYLEAMELISKKFGLHVRGFSPVELFRLAEKEKMPLVDLLRLLKEAGLGSVPGAGAEILTERMRQILSPKKLSAKDWCDVMGQCHQIGLPGSCNIVIGSSETLEDIVEHLGYLRDQQDKTGGFLSFVPWTFQPQTKRFPIRHVRGQDYLKMLAVSRLFLDNIPHVEVSILGLGRELGELGLNAGADDINSIVIEENVLRSYGLKTLKGAVRFIEEAGFEAKRRTLNYETEKYNDVSQYSPSGLPMVTQ